MAFVNEKDKSRVIDYKRNAYLTLARKPAIRNLNVHAWDLHWMDEVIYFAAFYEQEKNAQDEWEITWTVFQCVIPEHMRTLENKKTIKELISNALDTYGVMYGKTNVAKQHFAVDPYLKAFE